MPYGCRALPLVRMPEVYGTASVEEQAEQLRSRPTSDGESWAPVPTERGSVVDVARNLRLILSPPTRVWGLLSDGHRYGEWVSGTQQVIAADPHWPEVSARLRVRVGVGPLVLDDTCVVRICEPRRRLELEAKADPFGAVRIAMNLIPWGENTLFVLDWHPLRGPGTRMHGLPVDYIVSIRNGMMLTKLARIAVREHRGSAGGALQGIRSG